MDPHTKAQYNENVKKVKDKETNLRAAREKQLVIYKGTLIRLRDFSAETLQARSSGIKYSKCLKKKTSIKNTLSSKVIIQNRRRKSVFPDKQKLKEFITTKLVL